MHKKDFINPMLPDNLPVPEDDGACNHLKGMYFPSIYLETTNGWVNLADLSGIAVVYIYPRSSPDNDDPDGWDAIPGARGCSPQGCAFRDHQAELLRLGACVFGLSTQDISYLQREVIRLHLPFRLISDSTVQLREALRLPLLNIEVGGRKVYKRVTLILYKGRILKVFYPIFPPHKNAENVITWLKAYSPLTS